MYRYIGIFYALAVAALIVAKLVGFLYWPWWVVAIPIWGPVALAFIAAILFGVGLLRAESQGENPFQ